MISKAWLKLSRIGGITSALGTGQAGLYLGHAEFGIDKSALMLGASASLYLFGMISNDVLDHKKDALLRPERPIPAGLISLKQAKMALLGIVAIMVLLSLGLEDSQRMYFFISASAILLYNGPFKGNWWLATCIIAVARASHFLVGYGPLSFDLTWTGPAAAIACHTITIMILAEGEDSDTPIPLWIWAWNSLSALCLFGMSASFFALGPTLLWLGFSSWIIWQFRSESRQVRPRLIGAMVGAFTLLDASYLLIMGAHQMVAAFILLYLIGKKLSRRFPPG